jgi:hypothetical protein
LHSSAAALASSRRSTTTTGHSAARRSTLGRRATSSNARITLGPLLPNSNDQVSSRNRPTLGDVDLLHDPTDSGRHIHRRLLGFEGDERGFRFDLLAGFDEDVDDRDILEIAHIGHSHFDEACSRVHGISLQIFQGTGLEGSMPSFCIAAITVFSSTLPSSASDLRAATTM